MDTLWNPWSCRHCENINNYSLIHECDICGERIDWQNEQKCIYKLAEHLLEHAVFSRDFENAKAHYARLGEYKDAKQKCGQCQFKADTVRVSESVYEKANQQFLHAKELDKLGKWVEAGQVFTDAELLFRKIGKFIDAFERAEACHREIFLCQCRPIYAEAKMALFMAKSMEDYQQVAQMFSGILDFEDAKENYEFCLGAIAQLEAQQQLAELTQAKQRADGEQRLDEKIKILRRIVKFEGVALTGEARQLVLQCKLILKDCEDEQSRIKQREDLIEATGNYHGALRIEYHAHRLDALQKIIKEYGAYRKVAAFSELFANCEKQIDVAMKHVGYRNAVAQMQVAVTPGEYKQLAVIFSRMSGFLDADEKRKECCDREKYLRDELAIESIRGEYKRTKKINIFNLFK